MAGDWIKMRSDLFTHPKVVRIASAVKADTLRTVGGLMSVWCLFGAHSTDGILDGYTPETLDDHLRWPGFAAAMTLVNWLHITKDENGESLALPEFDTHNGQSAKRRVQDADRKREGRKTSASDADTSQTRAEKKKEELSTSHTGVTFEMTVGWQHSEHLPDMVRQAGAQITPAIVQEFIAYWLGRPKTKRTQAEWDKALLESALHSAAKKTAKPASKKLIAENFAVQNYGEGVTTL
jgi:hypothetical protein